ncbi:MAG: toll/interleukin-1 receptor domain-containing protein [Thiothrix sp.]
MFKTYFFRYCSIICLAVALGLLLPACGDRPETAPAPEEAPVVYSMQEAPPAGDALGEEAPAMLAPVPPPATAEKIMLEPEFGNILFNPPTEMTKDKTERIEVRISREALDDAGLIGRGEVIRDTVRVSNLMSVALYGDKFRVVSITDEKQLVEPTGYTEWSFDVTPLVVAKGQILTLKVSVHLPSGVKNKLVYSRPISIDVDGKSAILKWLVENWKLLVLLAFVAALVSYLVRNLQKAKKPYKRSGNEAVFISYRRDDSSGYTLAIYEQLKKALGDDAVFMDLDDIPHGEDFVEHIEKVLAKANTLLVMIGERWVNAANAKGRRLDDPGDFVRLEVAKALHRNIRVIPVLLKNAQMPGVDQLPEDLHKLTRKNGIRIHDDQFEASVQRLLEAIAAQ